MKTERRSGEGGFFVCVSCTFCIKAKGHRCYLSVVGQLYKKGALKTYCTPPIIKERGRKRTCDPQCKVCLSDGAMIVAVAHACKPQCRLAHCHLVIRLAGKWFVFGRKNEKPAGAKRWIVLFGSLISSLLFSFSLSLFLPPPPLSISLSSFLSLSPSPSLFLSHTVSLSRGTHTQKHGRVNAHSNDGPTDVASNCIHLVGRDSWSIVTVESTHNPPAAPKASPLPENRRHASRTVINQHELEHDDDHRMQNCTQT